MENRPASMHTDLQGLSVELVDAQTLIKSPCNGLDIHKGLRTSWFSRKQLIISPKEQEEHTIATLLVTNFKGKYSIDDSL